MAAGGHFCPPECPESKLWLERVRLNKDKPGDLTSLVLAFTPATGSAGEPDLPDPFCTLPSHTSDLLDFLLPEHCNPDTHPPSLRVPKATPKALSQSLNDCLSLSPPLLCLSPEAV